MTKVVARAGICVQPDSRADSRQGALRRYAGACQARQSVERRPPNFQEVQRLRRERREWGRRGARPEGHLRGLASNEYGRFETWTQAQSFATMLNQRYGLDIMEAQHIIVSASLAAATSREEKL